MIMWSTIRDVMTIAQIYLLPIQLSPFNAVFMSIQCLVVGIISLAMMVLFLGKGKRKKGKGKKAAGAASHPQGGVYMPPVSQMPQSQRATGWQGTGVQTPRTPWGQQPSSTTGPQQWQGWNAQPSSSSFQQPTQQPAFSQHPQQAQASSEQRRKTSPWQWSLSGQTNFSAHDASPPATRGQQQPGKKQ